MWSKLDLKSTCFIRYFIKGDIAYFYQDFVEGYDSLKFSQFIKRWKYHRTHPLQKLVKL